MFKPITLVWLHHSATMHIVNCVGGRCWVGGRREEKREEQGWDVSGWMGWIGDLVDHWDQRSESEAPACSVFASKYGKL
jgi:hypothetical protein